MTRHYGRVVAMAVLSVVLSSSVPPTLLAQQPAATGALSGVVTNEAGTQPLRSAYVVLIGATTGVLKVSSSDRDGRFTFTGLPADRYTVGASKPPYLGAIAGAKRPARPGVPVVLANGQQITNVAVRLPMGAAISGMIADERGRPTPSTAAVLHQWKMQGTERALVQVASVTTDDRGAYRFSGLIPGEYVVSSTRAGALPFARPLSAADVDAALKSSVTPAPGALQAPPVQVGYASVFFPGTARASDAQIIAINTGEDRRNVDFRTEPARTARVDGVVVTPGGQLPPNLMLQARSFGAGIQMGMGARLAPDGRFSLPNVPPGSYRLQVTGTGPLAGQFASGEVEVSGADVSGLQLIMKPALTFSGTLAFQGDSPAPSAVGRRVPLRGLTASVSGPAQAQVTATDNTGRFSVTNVMPGRYVLGGSLALGPTSDTINWVLRSVTIDGRDVTDLPIEIVDSPPKDVVVTYGDQWQELSGRLQSSSGAPISDVTIVVFPEDKPYWFQGSRRIVAARPDTDGRFTLSGRGPATLPPGRYLLATVADLARDEQFDPAFLTSLLPGTIPIALQPGEKKVQDLTVK